MGDHPVHVPHRHRFYVYEIIDPRNREVFYVGCGSGRRWRHSATSKRGSKRKRLTEIRALGLHAVPRIVASFANQRDALVAELKWQLSDLGAIRSPQDVREALRLVALQGQNSNRRGRNRDLIRPPLQSWCGHPDYKIGCPVLPKFCVPPAPGG